jgi:histone acetyltransferase (RNA polymerase elongator complex component)
MIGLPGDTPEKDIFSACELVKIKPAVARLYPTMVIEGTELHRMYLSGEYTPLTLKDSIAITKEMYKIISAAEINIIRIGLKSPAAVKSNAHFHPVFRQLVESEIAKETLENQLNETVFPSGASVKLTSNGKSFTNMIGHKKSNKEYFSKKYPSLKFSYTIDETLKDGQYVALNVVAEES